MRVISHTSATYYFATFEQFLLWKIMRTIVHRNLPQIYETMKTDENDSKRIFMYSHQVRVGSPRVSACGRTAQPFLADDHTVAATLSARIQTFTSGTRAKWARIFPGGSFEGGMTFQIAYSSPRKEGS